MSDRERWDEKYRSDLAHRKTAPDPFVLSALEEFGSANGRRALDLAAGTGRHALELARRGWNTTAWDVSSVGLEELARRARAEELRVATRAVDILTEPIATDPFDVLVCTDFLDRDLWQRLGPWVRPGGHAILITFAMDYPGPKPSARFRLELDELANGLEGFETVRREDAGGRSGILAKRLGP